MKFRTKKFITIRLFVADVSKSRDWYRSFFGIEPIEDQENFVSFKIANTCFDISLADEKSPVSRGGTVGYWLVDDLEGAIEHAVGLGAQVYRGPLPVNEVQRTIVQILEPHGSVFGLEAEF